MPNRRRYDDEDDRPRRRRRDDDDADRPRRRPQSRTPFLVIGILAAVVFVCSGIGGFVYFAVVLKRIEAAKRAESQPPPFQTIARPRDAKLDQLRAGMTRAEVEALFGPLRPAERADMTFALNVQQNSFEAQQRWTGWFQDQRVFAWRVNNDCVLVAFGSDPPNGLIGAVASMGSTNTHAEPVKIHSRW